ncbi:MAG: hypothetical protein QXD03_03430 [Candidatus Anstonellales archaeon]
MIAKSLDVDMIKNKLEDYKSRLELEAEGRAIQKFKENGYGYYRVVKYNWLMRGGYDVINEIYTIIDSGHINDMEKIRLSSLLKKLKKKAKEIEIEFDLDDTV